MMKKIATAVIPLVVVFAVTFLFADFSKSEPAEATSFESVYEKAKEGDAQAQNSLGLMYANGRGVAQNDKEAYIWYSIAAANGQKQAMKYRDDTAKLLSASDLAAAQAEATRRLEEIRK